MKRYKNYKDSGLEWLGKIPAHWEIQKIRRCIKTIADGGTPKRSVVEYWNGNINWLVVNDIKDEIWGTSEKLTDLGFHNSSSKLWDKNDIIISLGATIGEVGIAKIPLCTKQGIAGIKVNKKIHTNYLFYYLKLCKPIFNAWATGTTIFEFRTPKVNDFITPLPPNSEQIVISKYLKKKIFEIDELITKKKRLLELYEEEKTAIIDQAVTKGIDPNVKMKDSGVEWLGEIPEQWILKKFSQISYMKGRIGWQGLKQSEFTMNQNEPFLITGMNFKGGFIHWEDVYHIPEKRYEEAPEIQLKKGDVLITKDGTIGKLLYIDEIPFPYRASLNSHLLVLRSTNNQYNPKFMYFQLQSTLFKNHIELTKTGTTFFGISQFSVGQYKALLPPMIEQIKIYKFIERKLSYLKSKIKNTVKLIELLKEYKTALISEVVTGKIKVV